MALTLIQKEIEARNIELGRKLLAYEVMLITLKHIASWTEFAEDRRLAAIRDVARTAIAKAEGKP